MKSGPSRVRASRTESRRGSWLDARCQKRTLRQAGSDRRERRPPCRRASASARVRRTAGATATVTGTTTPRARGDERLIRAFSSSRPPAVRDLAHVTLRRTRLEQVFAPARAPSPTRGPRRRRRAAARCRARSSRRLRPSRGPCASPCGRAGSRPRRRPRRTRRRPGRRRPESSTATRVCAWPGDRDPRDGVVVEVRDPQRVRRRPRSPSDPRRP